MPGFSSRASRKTASTVRRASREKRNLVGQRRQTFPSGGKGGSCECEEIHRFMAAPAPTAGTFRVTYTIDGTSYEASWAWNASRTVVRDALLLHPKINAGDISVDGGPWPTIALYVKFKGDLSGISIAWPSISNTGLTGGRGIMDKFTAVEIAGDE